MKKQEHTYSTVLSIDPYHDRYYTSVSNFLNKIQTPIYDKDQASIAFINSRGFINAQLSISKNIPNEDLEDAIVSKTYDELGLDQALEYNIQFFETFSVIETEFRYFQIFVVDPNYLKEIYTPIVKKVKYIDNIIPTPLLFKLLYAKKALNKNGVHAFIYFQEDDAFVALYNNKEFLYTKSLKYSYKEIHERFCELYGEQIPYKEFIHYVKTRNLRKTNDEYTPFFIKLYQEIFTSINDILTYAKRAFDLEQIDHIYIGGEYFVTTKLYEFIEYELHIRASDLSFDLGFETPQHVHIQQIHALMSLYYQIPSQERYEINFTLYERPPKFIQRDSGKLILTIVASLVAGFSYPTAYWILTSMQEITQKKLEQEYTTVHKDRVMREALLKRRNKDKQKAISLLAQEKLEFSDKKNTLIKIHKIQVNYPMKAKILANFTADLNRFNVHLQEISYHEDNKKLFTFKLVANNDTSITNLIRFFLSKYNEQYNFDFQGIYFDNKESHYISELKVELR